MKRLSLDEKKNIVKELLGDLIDHEFVEWLERIGYFDVPAGLKHHSTYHGGLFNHSLQVVHELTTLTKDLGLTWARGESPAIIGLFHDLCKTDDYVWNNQEEWYEWNKDALYAGHGEKSLIILAGKLSLTEEETLCIRYHQGAFVDKNEWAFYTRAIQRKENVLFTHMADMIAAHIKGV